MSAQNGTAIAADPVSGYPPRLAVATKPGKRLVRVLLYELLGGSGNGLPRGATAMCTGQTQIADTLSVKVPRRPADEFSSSSCDNPARWWTVLSRVRLSSAPNSYRDSAMVVRQAMAWVGGRVLLCTSLQYSVLDPGTGACTPLFSLPADAPSPTLILPMPAAELAILLMVSQQQHGVLRMIWRLHVTPYACPILQYS